MTLPILTDPITTNRDLWNQGLDAYPASTGDVLGATLRETFARNPTPGLLRSQGRFEEDAAAMAGLPGATRMLEPDEATERYGIPGQLKFDAPLSEFSAREIYHLKRDEIARKSVMARGSGGLAEGAAQLGVGLVGSVLDPLNIASAFIPVVPHARYAIAMARAETAAARLATRARLGAIEGAAGAVLLEPIVASVAADEHADYTLMDSFLNVTFGTVLGGGLHALGGAVADAVRAGRAAGAPMPDERLNAPSTDGRRSVDDLAADRLDPAEPVVRPAELGPRDLAVDQAGLRAAVADLADTGSVRNAELAVRNEIEQLRNAYGEVRARPLGPADDVLATIEPADISRVLVNRGPVRERDGGIEVTWKNNRGYGLAKIIWKHGEASGLEPGLKVTEGDVLALPEVLRDFKKLPPRSKGASVASDQEGYRQVWRVDRGGRAVVYATTRWNGDDRLVTIHVDPKSNGPFSEQKGAGGSASSDRIISPPGDTARGPFYRPSEGQSAPAPRNLGASEPERNPGLERASAAAKEPPPESPAERLTQAAEAADTAEADLARALAAADPETRAAVAAELDAIKAVADEGQALEGATRAAAQCLRGN